MASTTPIPKDKKELSNLILQIGKDLLTTIIGNFDGMKYITPLYYNNNNINRKPRGEERIELPPFKIIFKQLSEAIQFKEKAIEASKDPSHKLYKAYLSNQQTIGTRIRLGLLWGVAEYLKKKEKQDSWVSQSSPKPMLMAKAPNSNLVKTYSYIEAITTYGEKIDKKVIDDANKLASKFFYGQVEKVFIILKD